MRPWRVKTAKLDKFESFTARLSLKNNLFVAYSKGKLPFDQEKDRIYKIGWSYKLEQD